MHEKDIKRIVREQLKKKHPNWKRLSRKKKNSLPLGLFVFHQVAKLASLRLAKVVSKAPATVSVSSF